MPQSSRRLGVLQFSVFPADPWTSRNSYLYKSSCALLEFIPCFMCFLLCLTVLQGPLQILNLPGKLSFFCPFTPVAIVVIEISMSFMAPSLPLLLKLSTPYEEPGFCAYPACPLDILDKKFEEESKYIKYKRYEVCFVQLL